MNNINLAIIFADYKKGNTERICTNCAFNDMGACALFDFNFDEGFTCDRFREELPPQLKLDYEPDEDEIKKWLS